MFLLYIHQRMTSQIKINVTAPARDALIGEKYGLKKVSYIHSRELTVVPSGILTLIMVRILGISPERKNTVIAFTP